MTSSEEEQENPVRLPRTGVPTLIGTALFLVLGACTPGSSIHLAGPRPTPDAHRPAPPDTTGVEDEADPGGEKGAGAGRTATRAPATGDATALEVVETALGAMGTPYQWGGTDANGFDCSGLIRFAYSRQGIQLPRVSGGQLEQGSPVELSVPALRPGDILGFSQTPGGEASHVGLYVGQGEFIHSSTSGVRVSTFDNPYWRSRFVAARRVLR